jgi:outer membrane receptor for ferrienterochelin and colicins
VKNFACFLIFLVVHFGYSQEKNQSFRFVSSDKRECKMFFLIGTKYSTQTDSLGHYTIENIAQGHYKIQISSFETLKRTSQFNK